MSEPTKVWSDGYKLDHSSSYSTGFDEAVNPILDNVEVVVFDEPHKSLFFKKRMKGHSASNVEALLVKQSLH